ncbi:MAG TPA: YvrJ family protein [Patescibacteria group bacterium]|nr:YvrJ family protein [Patescibacteria group bacterium]
MEMFLNYCSGYGFPMVVAAYLLVRMEGKLTVLTDSINELTRAIAQRM